VKPWVQWWWLSLGAAVVLPGCSGGSPWVQQWFSLGAAVVLPGCSGGSPWVQWWFSLGAVLVLKVYRAPYTAHTTHSGQQELSAGGRDELHIYIGAVKSTVRVSV